MSARDISGVGTALQDIDVLSIVPHHNAWRVAPHQLQLEELCQLRKPLESVHSDTASLGDSERRPGLTKIIMFRFNRLLSTETALRMRRDNSGLNREHPPISMVHLCTQSQRVARR